MNHYLDMGNRDSASASEELEAGARISDEETQQYHPDVIVMWQPKAWYDNATCNKWVAMYALKVPCPHMPNLNNPNPNPNPNPRR